MGLVAELHLRPRDRRSRRQEEDAKRREVKGDYERKMGRSLPKDIVYPLLLHISNMSRILQSHASPWLSSA
jgi:hypothetical protein